MTAKHPGLFRSMRQTILSARLPRAAASLAGLLLLSLATVGVWAGDANQAFFAEPRSGRKVTHYDIDLPVKQDQRESFHLPDDCSRVMQTINGGMTYHNNILDRRLWKKAESDCRYHEFLNRHPQQVIEDHVSDYDFRNAQIDHLPLDRRCARSGPASDTAGCNPAATDEYGMLRYFPIATVAENLSDRAECIPCRLSHGRFRGYVLIDQDGVQCKIDADAPGLRLIAVDFADINGDRILDAVLRFIPIGPGMNRAPLVLPLTKLTASAPFSVPQTAHAASTGGD